MKLVETEVERPEDDVEPPHLVTPPRPEKRGAYASLSFTLAVLVGIVVTIYSVFPARKVEATHLTIANHRRAEQPWELVEPARAELEAWAIGVVGSEPPLPEEGADAKVIGARRVWVRHRDAVFVRFRIVGAGDVSYLVQPAHTPEERTSRRDGSDHVVSWRSGAWTCIAVGPAESAGAWTKRVGAPAAETAAP